MTFEVRVRALASSRLSLCVDEVPLGEHQTELSIGGRSWNARLCGRETVGGSVTDLLLRASGFDSAEMAQESGGRLRDALLLGGIIYGAGFDVGLHDPRMVCDIVDDKIVCVERLGGAGVWVRESDDGPHYVAEFRGFLQPVPVDDFFNRVDEIVSNRVQLGASETLSLALYSVSHFLVSPQARFVSLVSAIESLSPRDKRSADVRKLVHELQEEIMNTLQAPSQAAERTALASSVRALARISIGEACKRTIRHYLGEDDADAFPDFYDIRSTLVHTGRVRTGVDMDHEVCRLDWLVRRLLLEYVNAMAPQSDQR